MKKGKSYRVCAIAGNTRRDSALACRSIQAQLTTPIATLRLEPSEQIQGRLNAYWDLAPFVNPTWDPPCGEGEVSTTERPCSADSTHYPPMYRVASREVVASAEEWPDVDTDFRIVYQGGPKGGASFSGLKQNTEYEVAVQSGYCGEGGYGRVTGRTLMNPARNVVVGFGADAVSVAFDGLKAGQWYHVNIRAVGEGDYRSAVRPCYFQHGTDGSQNRVGAGWQHGPSCAAPVQE